MGEGLSKQGAVARRLLLREVTEIMVTAAIPKQAFSGNGEAGRLAASLSNPEAVCWRPMKRGIVSVFLLPGDQALGICPDGLGGVARV